MTDGILEQYSIFVDGVTSSTSKSNQALIDRIADLDKAGVNVSRLITSGLGLAGESGEVVDVIKKLVFHGKPWSEEMHTKLIDECSDVLWYWTNLCLALEIDPVEVIHYNINKLQTRYPGGKFDVERSEHRIV